MDHPSYPGEVRLKFWADSKSIWGGYLNPIPSSVRVGLFNFGMSHYGSPDHGLFGRLVKHKRSFENHQPQSLFVQLLVVTDSAAKILAMDRVQLLLLGLPLFLLCTDLVNLFTPPPPKPSHHPRHHHHHHEEPPAQPVISETLEVPSQKSVVGGIGLGSSVKIDFCSSCSYRGTAVTMKKMLETQFPGIDVVLANYPPTLPKRLLSKLVPVAQIGVMGIVLAGEQIFPMLGFMTPPPWFHSLRANKFGTIASTWLLGNALQSFLQSSGAFEVYCNDDLVFSKLKEGRFPGEIELKDLVGRRLTNSKIADVWS